MIWILVYNHTMSKMVTMNKPVTISTQFGIINYDLVSREAIRTKEFDFVALWLLFIILYSLFLS